MNTNLEKTAAVVEALETADQGEQNTNRSKSKKSECWFYHLHKHIEYFVLCIFSVYLFEILSLISKGNILWLRYVLSWTHFMVELEEELKKMADQTAALVEEVKTTITQGK